MRMLDRLKIDALELEKISALIQVIDDELGFKLYKAIECTRAELSEKAASTFLFEDSQVRIENGSMLA